MYSILANSITPNPGNRTIYIGFQVGSRTFTGYATAESQGCVGRCVAYERSNCRGPSLLTIRRLRAQGPMK